MAETPEHQAQYFNNISGYLEEIGKIVGEPVGLFVSGSANPITGSQQSLFNINVWDNPNGLRDKDFLIRYLSYPTYVSKFRVVPFPGCCALCISTGVAMFPGFANRGISTIANKIRQEIAKLSGYTAMVATDMEANTFQRKIFQKNDWTDIYKVRNRRTRNVVIISIKNLEHIQPLE